VEQKSRSKSERRGYMENQDKPYATPSQEDFLLSGHKGLVAAMLTSMMKDLTIPDSEIEVHPHDGREVKRRKKEKEYYKHSAYCFVRSEWFEDLCLGIGINPQLIRQYAIEFYNESKKK